MGLRNLFAFLAMLLVSTEIGVAQTQITIDDEKLSCRARNGQMAQVLIQDTYNGQNVDQKWGGAVAFPQTDPVIVMSRKITNNFGPLAAIFTFFHECGHLVNDFGARSGTTEQEMSADCFAVRSMRERGLIPSTKEFSEAMANLRQQLPGAHYPPGTTRIAHAYKCAGVFAAADDTAVCQVVDRILLGDTRLENKMKSLDELPKNYGALKGFYCDLDQDDGVRCRGNISSKSKRIGSAERLSSQVQACLPDVYFESGSSYAELLHRYQTARYGDVLVSIVADSGIEMVEFSVSRPD